MKWSLPAFAIERPVAMTMLVITLLSLGAISWYLTPIEFIPRVDVPILTCYIPYPGAAPQQVENEVAIPAEGEFRTLSGMERITTHSYSGGCYVVMRFGWDTNMMLATADLRDRIERLKLKLPVEIEQIFIRRFHTDQEPIMRFALFREEQQDELAHAARTLLQNRLLRIEGVADVEVSGRASEEVYVEFDQNALRSLNLGIYAVVAVLQASSINLSAGTLVDGDTKYYVCTAGELSSPDELADLVIAPNGIRLKDVAKVSLRPPEGVGSFSVDGKHGVFIRIQKESEANTVATCDAVRAELERVKSDPVFRGVEIFVFDDQSEIIRFAINALLKAGKYGSLLAFLVLLFALRRLGPTIIVALITPTSLVAAIAFLFLSSHSLNLVTMAAMLVSVGLLVDNAIVVIENIQRYHQLSPDRRLNAQRGASEVGMAITASTSTTVVVFIPVMYMEAGELSLFMKEFAGPMTTALFASLVLALTILPLAESRLLPAVARLADHAKAHLPYRGGAPFPRLRGAVRKVKPIEWVRSLYGDLLALTLKRRTISLGMLAALLLITYCVPYRRVGMREMPTIDLRQVSVNFRADPNYGYENVSKTVDHLERVINARRKELGIQALYVDRWGTGAYICAYLVKSEDLPRGETVPYTTEEVRDVLSEILPEQVPGGQVDCGVARAMPMETQAISMRIRGDDTDRLYELAEEFRWQMANLPELSKVKTNRDENSDEIQIRIDEPKAAAAGASPVVIARTVSFALGGNRLPFLKKEGREISVWAQFQGEDRRTKGNLENVMVQGKDGELYALNQLVSMHKAPSLAGVYREDGKSVATLTAETTERNLSRVRDHLGALAGSFELPSGYSITLGDQLRQIDENLRNFHGALLMAVVLIYLVMAALFESALLPLSILTSVALAFVGVYWSLYLSNTPMDTVSLIGSILMCGLIVNNGIVIVDHINHLRQQGLGRVEAILQAGHDRFRPVMMTSLTTILGCLPLAVGSTEAASALTGLGRAFVGGLSAGTLLTLFVVPVFYTVVDDLQAWFLGYLGSLVHLGRLSDTGIETKP